MQVIPVSRGVGRQGLHPEDDRGGEELQGAAAVAAAIPGVREGVGKGVTGDAPPKPGVEKGGLISKSNEANGGDDPRNYILECPANAGPRPCPVKGCSSRASTRTAVRVQFWQRHVRNTVVILEVGNPPPPTVPPV